MRDGMDYTDQLGTDDAYQKCIAVLRYGENETHVRLTSPYSPDWVQQVKAAVPSRARDWNPALRYWLFKAFPQVIEKVKEASLAQGWAVREEWADGRRLTTYPNGEVVEEKQEDLFDGF